MMEIIFIIVPVVPILGALVWMFGKPQKGSSGYESGSAINPGSDSMNHHHHGGYHHASHHHGDHHGGW